MEQRVDLVPELLAADLCSLHAHADRLAISVIWHLDEEANQLSPPRFERSVIRSSAALSYAEAQAVIDDAERGRPPSRSGCASSTGSRSNGGGGGARRAPSCSTAATPRCCARRTTRSS